MNNESAKSQSEPHGWPNTETLKTRVGDFEFKNGYPTDETAERLRDLQTLNRATEVYLTQVMRMSETAWREGMRAFGSVKPQQVVIWEDLADPKTLLLTSNAETVYALAHLALQDDGPTVVEASPNMLGFLMDGLQRYLTDIGPMGKDQGLGPPGAGDIRRRVPGDRYPAGRPRSRRARRDGAGHRYAQHLGSHRGDHAGLCRD